MLPTVAHVMLSVHSVASIVITGHVKGRVKIQLEIQMRNFVAKWLTITTPRRV